MITFEYGKTQLKDGYYVLEVEDKRLIAEYFGDSWYQIGIDYDRWQCDPEKPEIKVLFHIDLDDLRDGITEIKA